MRFFCRNAESASGRVSGAELPGRFQVSLPRAGMLDKSVETCRARGCVAPFLHFEKKSFQISICMYGGGQAITHRTSQVRPIQPALPAHTAHARPNRGRLYPVWLANGRWPVPFPAFRAAGLRGRRNRRQPGAVARGDICSYVRVSTNAHRLCSPGAP